MESGITASYAMLNFQIFTAVIFFSLNGAMTRLFQLKIGKKPQAIRIYQALFCAIAALLNLISGGAAAMSAPAFVAALAFGLLFAIASHFSAECYRCGPMSLTSLIMNLSLSIPLVYSFVVFGESVTASQIAGLALLCATFALSAFCSSDGGGKISLKWSMLVLFGFLANGFTAVIQKSDASVGGGGGMFLFTAYLFSALYFSFLYIKENKGIRGGGKQISSAWQFLLASALAGAGSFVGNALLGYLSVRVNAALLYPSVNGGLALVTALISFIFFKEKLNKAKIVSIIVGVAAIILLAM